MHPLGYSDKGTVQSRKEKQGKIGEVFKS